MSCCALAAQGPLRKVNQAGRTHSHGHLPLPLVINFPTAYGAFHIHIHIHPPPASPHFSGQAIIVISLPLCVGHQLQMPSMMMAMGSSLDGTAWGSLGAFGPLIVELLFDTFGRSRTKVNGNRELNCSSCSKSKVSSIVLLKQGFYSVNAKAIVDLQGLWPSNSKVFLPAKP